MKKLLLLILIVYSMPVFALDPQAQFQEANKFYKEAEFEKAVELYEQLTSEKLYSPELHYNLGNAYYRLNEFAPAILHFEKAIKLDPGMEDARFNLRMARTKIKDKAEILPEPSIVLWWKSLVASKTPDGWTWLSIQFLVLALLAFGFFRLSKKISLKKGGFYTGVFLLLVFFLTSFFALNRNKHYVGEYEAIVFTPSVTVLSAPGDNGAGLYVIHDGLKVKITSSSDDWYEIKIPNGEKGWVKKEHLRTI